jgi:hypothetical protein
MHAIVNHLPIKEDADWTDIATKCEKFAAETRAAHPELQRVIVVKVDDREAILVAIYTDRESLDRLSREVAGPWFAENIRRYLAGPVSRSVGEIIAGAF